jgi:sugar phosphate isomerase/epimerase
MHAHHIIVCIIALCVAAAAWAQTPAPIGPVAAGLRNPFFAMDTGLRDGQSRTTEAQLDLVRELGYAGLSWTQGDPKQTREAADAAKVRGLKLFTVYCGATLTKEKLDYGATKQTIDALKGTDTMIWLYLVSKDFPKSSADGDDIAVAGLRDLADYAQAAGLKIALYPHAGFWVERVQDAVRVDVQPVSLSERGG